MRWKRFSILLVIILAFSFVASQINHISAATSQTVTTKVKVTERSVPGYYWCQHGDGHWSTSSYPDGYVTANDAGGQPEKKRVTTTANLSTPTTNWVSANDNKPVSYSNIKNIKIANVEPDLDTIDPNIQASASISSDKQKVIITGYSGKGIEGRSDMNVCGDNPSMVYPFPLVVTWEGEIEETKRIRVLEDSVLGVGQSKQLKAEVDTTAPNGTWQGWWDVSDRTSETTWTSSNTSVASVSADGQVTAKAVGKTTVTARWRSGGFDLQASVEIEVTAEDVLEIIGTLNACLVDEIQLKAELTANGSTSNVTNHASLSWSSSDTNKAMVNHQGSVFAKRTGTVTITATYNNVSQLVFLTDTFELQIVDCSEEPLPDPEPEPDDNIPPVAIIDTPYDEYKAGNRVVYYGDESYDPDAEPNSKGEIEQNGIRNFFWEHDEDALVEDAKKGEDDDSYSLYYMEEGFYDMFLRVRDRSGDSGETTYPIRILPPTIEAEIHAKGYLKENRHVILESKIDTPTKFPQIRENTVWTIKPLDGQKDSICVRGNAKCQQTIELTGVQKLDVLFKEEGAYEINIHVENTAGYEYDTNEVIYSDGYSDPYLYIDKDYKPFANLSTVKTIYRDIDNNKKANVKLTDTSFSEDDIIAQRIWKISYDSDNDGIFSDEVSMLISNTNKTYLEHEVDKVGKYKISLEVIEKFAQPTLEEFVTPEDRKRDDTTDIDPNKLSVEVQNHAPVVGFEPKKRTTIDLNVAVGNNSVGNIHDIETRINELLAPRLNEKNVRMNLNVIEQGFSKKVEDRQLMYEFSSKGKTFFEVYMYHDNESAFVEVKAYNEKYSDNGRPERVCLPEDIHVNNKLVRWGNDDWERCQDIEFGSSYSDTVTFNIGQLNSKNVLISGRGYSDNNNHKIDGYRFRFIFDDDDFNREVPEYRAVASSYSGPEIITDYTDMYTYGLNNSGSYKNSGGTFGKNGSTTLIGYTSSYFSPQIQNANQIVSVSHLTHVVWRNRDSRYEIRGIEGPYRVDHWYERPGLSSFRLRMNGTSKQYVDFTSEAKRQFSLYGRVHGWAFTSNTDYLDLSDDDNDPEFEIQYIADPNYKPAKMNINRNSDAQFFSIVEDYSFTKLGREFIDRTLAQGTKTNPIHFIGLGRSSNRSSINSIISANENAGLYINNTNLDRSIEKMGDYILEVLGLSEPKNNELYITLDEQVDYFTTYMDLEEDPLFAEKWKYDHDPTVFENNQGQIENNMVYQNMPITKFKKVGRYQPYYTAQDDPLERFSELGLDPSKFEEYRKWAKDADNWYIYVHRKPVANFEALMKNSTGEIMIINHSYDLDKQSLPENGIKEKKWSYRRVGTNSWTEGKPTYLSVSYTWEIKLVVTDYQGATNEHIEYVQRVVEFPNKPPVANFDFDKPFYYIGDTIQITSKSTDPDGDILTHRYEIVENGGAKSTDTNKNPTYKPSQIGNVTVKLTVTDPLGLSDSVTKPVNVNDLIINGYVNHTPRWTEIHREIGTPEPIQNHYFSGEKFILSADIVDTGEAPIYVKVQAVGELEDGTTLDDTFNLHKNTNILYVGEYYREIFSTPGTLIKESLPPLTFKFEIQYSNGTIRRDEAQVNIIGNVYEAFDFHRNY